MQSRPCNEIPNPCYTVIPSLVALLALNLYSQVHVHVNYKRTESLEPRDCASPLIAVSRVLGISTGPAHGS